LSDLFVIAGLGNPGPKYAETRHNVGFWFLHELLKSTPVKFRRQSKLHAETARISIHGRPCVVVRPTTSMNLSGQAIRAVTDYYQVSSQDLLVAYDELDLPAGVSRLKQGGGHGGHNGIRDIFRHLPEHDFLRLRIGIGHPGSKSAVTNYVLSRPPRAEEEKIRDSINLATEVLTEILDGDVEKAMLVLHTKESEA
jgi:PTH1 family peptidyl-tRNA hydrolase